jgi:prepilin-type N-terminal cleavage/methylation domain-containing protein
MNRVRYSGFTLIEMLVVMGILVILMTMGIAAARFAIERANRIQHASAVDQLYQGFQAYFTDNREYPGITEFGNFGEALVDEGVLAKYIDTNSFEGGSDATYYYATDTTKQFILICVTLGGHSDVQEKGAYCNGNGFGLLPSESNSINAKDISGEDWGDNFASAFTGGNGVAADWTATGKVWSD